MVLLTLFLVIGAAVFLGVACSIPIRTDSLAQPIMMATAALALLAGCAVLFFCGRA